MLHLVGHSVFSPVPPFCTHCDKWKTVCFSFVFSMMLACFGGHLKVAIQLHEHGALLDTRDKGGSGCLHWAVDGGKPDCIQWLLDNGIQVNREFSIKVSWGST